MSISSDPPDDIMANILSRLPVQSLMQFRLVVKSWRNLITDPNFINMHAHQTSKTQTGYLIIKHHSSDISVDDEVYYYYHSLHSDETFDEHLRLEFPFTGSGTNFEIMGSSNGLLFLLYPTNMYGLIGRGMYLCNPITRNVNRISNSDQTLSLSSSHEVFGFGFLPEIGDYRVLRILYHENFNPLTPPKNPPVVEIYSLRADSWRIIETSVPYFIINPVSKAFVNGSVHWVGTRRTIENHHDDFIVSFDMVGEVFREMKLPNCSLDDGVLTGSLAVFGESLCLFARGNVAENEIWEIWVMEEYGSVGSWSKQFVIENNEGISWPLGFMKTGEVILGTIEGKLSLYEPKIQQVKDLHCHLDPDMLDIFPFMESLVLLDRK